ncbi:MAG: isochorismatase family cysteine hydrolase [Tistlia sp.]|uniref:cysteine hydrolase family protein n=1 Tax=Tistlia sp. TaxID=3057121 RepID=UPI0034A389E0
MTGDFKPGRSDLRRLDSRSTALLLIDVQNYVLDPDKHPPRPAFYERAGGLVLPTLRDLQARARAAGVEVIFTVMENLTRDGRDRSLDYKLSGFFIAKGSAEARVVEAVAPAADEIVLPKTSACLFNSTCFDYLLRNLGVETVLCTGFLTDQCVEQTMRQGCARGYRMVCVTDACAADTPERHEQALARFSGYGAQVAAGDLGFA